MSNEINVSSEYGPKKFRALFERGLDFALDRLLRRAEMQNGRLSGTEIREELECLKINPSNDMSDYFNESWEECITAVEQRRWDQKRRYPFERLMVNTFVSLLPVGDEVPIPGVHITRQIIPGFIIAMTQMLGEELTDKYEEYCRKLVSRLEVENGDDFNWKTVYQNSDAISVVSEVLITICHHFVDLKKRRRWLTDVINSQMGAPPASQTIPFEEVECHRLISALYQPLRDAMNASGGEKRIAELYGRDRAHMLRTVLAEITRYHRELLLRLNSPTDAA